MNPTILTALMHDGQPYGIPTGAHRSNVLWFNTKLLERAGVARPSSGYPINSFITDLGKIKASGATPLCLGAKDRFTTVELFENTLLSSIGTRGWQHLVHNGLDWRSKQVQAALNNFGAILRYADPEASQLTWDQATKKLAAGGCAFESMNDSAFGELIADGAHEGTDFGAVPFPGTQGSFLAVVDAFVAATKAKNAKNALAFLSGIDEPATQLAFSKAKGVNPCRPRRRRLVPARVSASVLEGVLDVAGAAIHRTRRRAEPRLPRGLLRRRLDLRPDTRPQRVRRRSVQMARAEHGPASLTPGRTLRPQRASERVALKERQPVVNAEAGPAVVRTPSTPR